MTCCLSSVCDFNQCDYGLFADAAYRSDHLQLYAAAEGKTFVPPQQKLHFNIFNWVEGIIKTKRTRIYIIYGLLLVFSVIGVTKMKVSGSLIGEMPKSASFFKDIVFYEKEFSGVMPLEIMIDTNAPQRRHEAFDNEKNG